jgi:hypothetical protein
MNESDKEGNNYNKKLKAFKNIKKITLDHVNDDDHLSRNSFPPVLHELLEEYNILIKVIHIQNQQ